MKGPTRRFGLYLPRLQRALCMNHQEKKRTLHSDILEDKKLNNFLSLFIFLTHTPTMAAFRLSSSSLNSNNPHLSKFKFPSTITSSDSGFWTNWTRLLLFRTSLPSSTRRKLWISNVAKDQQKELKEPVNGGGNSAKLT